MNKVWLSVWLSLILSLILAAPSLAGLTISVDGANNPQTVYNQYGGKAISLPGQAFSGSVSFLWEPIPDIGVGAKYGAMSMNFKNAGDWTQNEDFAFDYILGYVNYRLWNQAKNTSLNIMAGYVIKNDAWVVDNAGTLFNLDLSEQGYGLGLQAEGSLSDGMNLSVAYFYGIGFSGSYHYYLGAADSTADLSSPFFSLLELKGETKINNLIGLHLGYRVIKSVLFLTFNPANPSLNVSKTYATRGIYLGVSFYAF